MVSKKEWTINVEKELQIEGLSRNKGYPAFVLKARRTRIM